MFFSKMYTIAR